MSKIHFGKMAGLVAVILACSPAWAGNIGFDEGATTQTGTISYDGAGS